MKRIFAAISAAVTITACAAASGTTSTSPVVPTGALAQQGLAFAQRNCSACHAVVSPGLSPNPEAPTFADIANRTGLTDDTLSKWLRDAHNYPEAMQFDLDAASADALSAYIVTLRDPDYKPPIG